MTSWKAEVIADASLKWCAHGLRFKTKKQAESYLSDLYGRWTAVKHTRAKRCNDAPTHTWNDATWKAEEIDHA